MDNYLKANPDKYHVCETSETQQSKMLQLLAVVLKNY